MSAITAEGLYKVFGKRPKRGVAELQQGKTREDLQQHGLTAAVIDASFSVDPGEIFVVMGLSGSGKSTLIRMINGLFEPTAGTVTIADELITDVPAEKLRSVRREKISMVFQHFALLPHRTVGENAAYGLKIQGLNKTDREKAANTALDEVGLGGWGGHLPGQLSGGMQQRVGLARALAAGTDIMLMDEAFSALDPLIRREMQDQLLELQSELDKTILFITHDLNEAMRLGNRIAMMRDGRIVQIGTAEEILNDPASEYVSTFVEDVDRSRVLTARTIMEQPVAVIAPGDDPRTAHRLMGENQTNSLLVVGNDRQVQGIIREADTAEAVRAGREFLPVKHDGVARVRADVPLAELFPYAAATDAPLAVVNDRNELVGLIPRVTLLRSVTPNDAGITLEPVGEGNADRSVDHDSGEKATVLSDGGVE